MTLIVQSMVFGAMLVTGIAIGLAIDFCRFINRRGRGRLLPLLDFLLWVIITTVVFIVLININYLELRLYVFVSLSMGALLYFKLLSPYVLRFYYWSFKLALNMLQWTVRALYPFTLPARAVAGMMDNVIVLMLSWVARLLLGTGLRAKEG